MAFPIHGVRPESRRLRQGRRALVLAASLLLALGSAGLGLAKGKAATKPAPKAKHAAVKPAPKVQKYGVLLRGKASGKAELTFNPASKVLVVTVTVSGLAPKSSHPEHIHLGTCAKPGPIVYTLATLVANAKGVATATTTLSHVASVPSGKWIINVHQGPSLATKAGAQQIACGAIP